MTAVHAQKYPIRKQLKDLKMRVTNVANDPARRFKLLWYLVAWSCATIFLIIGVGYAGGGHSAIQSKSLNVVAILEGNLHIHGGIMVCIAAYLIYGLSDYRRVTRYGLIIFLFYSMWTAIQIFIGWGFYGVSWGAPWWYLLTSFLSGALLVLAPPLNKNGKRFAGLFERDDSV